MISCDLMKEPAITRLYQCGAVAQDCNSALLDAIQEKKTHGASEQTQPNLKLLSRVWMNMQIIYDARFPLNNKINTKTDSGEKAAVKKASGYSDVDACSSAL